MSWTSTQTFDDPIAYGGAIQGAETEMLAMGKGRFAAKLTRIRLDRLWMQRFNDNLPRLARAQPAPARTIFCFQTKAKSPLTWCGNQVPWGSLYRFGTEQEILQRAEGDTEWAAMSLPLDDYCLAASVTGAPDAGAARHGTVLRPAQPAFARLQYLHAAACRLAEHTPGVLENAEAMHSLEQELTQAMVDCATTGTGEADSASSLRNHAIMKRFHAVVEERGPLPLYVHEICVELGVSSRSLLRCCSEQLGVSPQRYLWLRRMNMARHALLRSIPGHESVTDIAVTFGFWELGRFSVAYRAQFGEQPSATLRRSARNT
jgi:AraC-like DNA-binding protein